jgi:hypothetical protein
LVGDVGERDAGFGIELLPDGRIVQLQRRDYETDSEREEPSDEG